MRNLTLTFFILATTLTTVYAGPSRKIVYKKIGDVELNLHIFEPKGHSPEDKKPAIVFFFGGGWVSFAPGHFFLPSDFLAKRGMVAICADYRTKKAHGTTPDKCVEDGKSALRYVRAHAKELGIDPEMIAAGGGSAGGHVAAAVATAKGFNAESDDQTISCMPKALALFNPVFDNGPGGYGHKRVVDYWEDFSPIDNIAEDTPPTLVMLGDQDKLLPVETVEKFKALMEAKGNRCDVRIFKGQGHGFFNSKEYREKTNLEMEAFLASLGFLKTQPKP